MSEESKLRIQRVIEELNYRPNNMARGLKSNKSNLIGVIVIDMTNPYYSILLKGIVDCCKEYGYNFVLANSENDSNKEKEYIQSMLDQRVDGLIINTTCNNNECLVELSEGGIPVVLADQLMVPTLFDTITTNDYRTTCNTIQHLFESGFRKVGFFTQEMDNVSTRKIRCQAYRDAYKRIMNENPQIYTINVKDENSVIRSIENFMKANISQPRAIFTVNNLTMLSVLQAINKLGLRIPQDIGIGGYDDLPWMELIGPGITAISLSSYELGQKCVKRLMMRINQKRNVKPKIIEIPSQLIVRGSTKLYK